MAELILSTQTTPSSPSAGNVGVFVDSADGFLKQVDSAGTVLKNVSGLPLALTGAAQTTRYVGATASGAPVAGTFAKGDMNVGQDGTLWICTVAGSPGTWVQVGSGGGGAMTQLFNSTLGADAASFDITPIAGTYNHLQLVASLRGARAVANVTAGIRFNNDSGANYDWEFTLTSGGAGPTGNQGIAQTSGFSSDAPAASATAGEAGVLRIDIPDYAGTTFRKVYYASGGYTDVGGNYRVFSTVGSWRNTAAITRITVLDVNPGNWLAGSHLSLYGIL